MFWPKNFYKFRLKHIKQVLASIEQLDKEILNSQKGSKSLMYPFGDQLNDN